jgi:hypothetical protein
MYAKEYFANTKFTSDPGLCFVLMPFAEQFNPVWETIRDTVGNNPFNLLVRRADDIDTPGYIMTDVWENIAEARLLIADLSGQNPNVFYELGIAHSFKNKDQVILISRDIDSIPFDLRQLRTIVYNNDLAKLKSSVSDTITELGIKQFCLLLKEGEAKKFDTRLTGDDYCLYEIEIFVEYVGDDGVKFRRDITKYVGGKDPKKINQEWMYLGNSRPAMPIPNLPWSMCYKKESGKQVRFILGRAPGWEPSSH